MRGTTLHRQESLSDASIIGTLPTVFIVEDDDNIRDLLVTLLIEEHYHVLSARSGEQALQILASHVRPSLLLLDYMLPGMDGILLYDQMCTHFSCRIPTLMLSAALPEHEVKERTLIGISKPFDIDYVLTLVEKNIEKSADSLFPSVLS